MIKKIEITKKWSIFIEKHGISFYGANWLIIPTISIYAHKDYFQIGFGWLNKSGSITFFNCR